MAHQLLTLVDDFCPVSFSVWKKFHEETIYHEVDG